jgi:integrase
MASARPRKNRWTGLYTDASGNQKSAGTYDDQKTALKAADHQEALARPPEAIEVHATSKRGRPTIAGYGPVAIAGAKLEATSQETYSHLLKHVIPILGSNTLADLTPADVRAFARNLENSEMSSSTAFHVFSVLKLIVVTALQGGLISKDVTAGISVQRKGSKQKIIATPAEAHAIEAAIDYHYRLLVETMFATGARYGELMAVRVSDIRDKVVDGVNRGMVLKIQRSIAGVNGQPVGRPYGKTPHPTRDIPVSASLASKLAAQGNRNKDGRIFTAKGGGIPSQVQLLAGMAARVRGCGRAGDEPGMGPGTASRTPQRSRWSP